MRKKLEIQRNYKKLRNQEKQEKETRDLEQDQLRKQEKEEKET